MDEKIYYSWNNFENDILLINSKIYESYWLPDCVVGIKRGGLIPAVVISHLLRIPMYTITYQTRDGCKKIDLSELPTLDDQKVLIIDDICDTGETFKELKNKINNKNIKYCSLFYNIRQDFIVDYFSRKIDRDKNSNWIVFPWELINTRGYHGL